MAIIIIGLIIILFTIDGDNNGDMDNNDIDNLLNELPKEISVGERIVLIDSSSIPYSSKDQYGGMDESLPEYVTGEYPLNYIEMLIRERLSQEHVWDYPSNMFDYSVSFYKSENGVAAFVRVMNFPDDSVGGEETRFDFVLNENSWILEWSGSKVFCRRMDNEYWAPWGELCP